MEMLVVNEDIVADDQYVDAQCYKRGDVVCYRPDGWAWGRLERDNPRFVILHCPRVSAAEIDALLAPEVGDEQADPRLLQRRGFRLNLASMGILAGERGAVTRDINDAQLRALRERKLPKNDGNVLRR